MKGATTLRFTAILILLFGVAHTLGYPWIGSVTAAQRALLVDAFNSTVTVMQGFPRSYEDTHIGFGFFISLFFVTQAYVVWHLSRQGKVNADLVRIMSITFAVQYCISVIIESYFLFWGPIIFSALIAAGFVFAVLQLSCSCCATSTPRDS